MEKEIKNLEAEIVEQEEQEEGATMIEYALLVALIAIIAIAAVRFLGEQVSLQFSAVAGSLTGGN